ncbi:MAG: undecaprenyl-diphosphate phosphatase, partial [Oscillospiraceae bacterium]|nr:undecaprenyl-diphosphate phosphatase [Oscillospiraceae bacterium]
MTLGFAVLLGLIQALTEFLPVSSSGHLSILQNLLGLDEVGEADVLFDVMLHFGTLISVVVMYRRDIRDMAKALGGVLRRRSRGSPPVTPAERGSARLILLVLIG